ncbi:MAG: prepilin-type N-terminal cleavage/methylation domain-containing protein [Desulfuromonadales bacterium]|jgi:general secretion pathway protein H
MRISITGRSSNSGFTLIELAVVVALLALFSALVVPMLTGIGENGLDASARRLAGTVKYLYNESALSGRPYRLVFNLDESTFSAKRLEVDGELVEVDGTGRTQRLKDGVRFRDVTITGRGQFSSGEVIADIHPVGWMEEAVIHLDAGADKVLTLRLMPFTGATEIYEGYREFETQR